MISFDKCSILFLPLSIRASSSRHAPPKTLIRHTGRERVMNLFCFFEQILTLGSCIVSYDFGFFLHFKIKCLFDVLLKKKKTSCICVVMLYGLFFQLYSKIFIKHYFKFFFFFLEAATDLVSPVLVIGKSCSLRLEVKAGITTNDNCSAVKVFSPS